MLYVGAPLIVVPVDHFDVHNTVPADIPRYQFVPCTGHLPFVVGPFSHLPAISHEGSVVCHVIAHPSVLAGSGEAHEFVGTSGWRGWEGDRRHTCAVVAGGSSAPRNFCARTHLIDGRLVGCMGKTKHIVFY